MWKLFVVMLYFGGAEIEPIKEVSFSSQQQCEQAGTYLHKNSPYVASYYCEEYI